ncbi:MAG: ATP-binding protein [Pirellulales bacterium]
MNEMSDLEHIRRRPSMYVGSTSQSGILQLVFEAVDNAVDQFLANKVRQMVVQIVGNTIRVSDDGEGYPFDRVDADGVSLGVKYLTQCHNTNTVDDHTPHVHANGWGCGLCVLNALSQRLEITSVRGGKLFHQSYSRGVAESPIREFDANLTQGTTIEFELDEQIFGDQVVDLELLGYKLRRLSFLFPGLVVRFQEEMFESKMGLVDLIRCDMGIESQHTFSFCVQHGEPSSPCGPQLETQMARLNLRSFRKRSPNLRRSSSRHVNGLKRGLASSQMEARGGRNQRNSLRSKLRWSN